jgi:hypothetical protein
MGDFFANKAFLAKPVFPLFDSKFLIVIAIHIHFG